MPLSTQLESVVQRTGAISGQLASASQRAAFLTASRRDLANVISQLNTVYYVLANTLISEAGLDALDKGLSGNVIKSNVDASAVSASIYWNTIKTRPNTLKESLDIVVSELSRLENAIVTVTSATVGSADNDILLWSSGAWTTGPRDTWNAVGDTEINLVDDQADAFVVQEGSNVYVKIVTTDAGEQVLFGNATTNPDFLFQGGGEVLIATGNFQLGNDVTQSFGDSDEFSQEYNSGGGTFNCYATAQPDIEYRMQPTTPAASESGHYFTADLGDVNFCGILNVSVGSGTAALTGTNTVAGMTVSMFAHASDAAGTARAGYSVTPLLGTAGSANYTAWYMPSPAQFGSPPTDWTFAFGSGNDRASFWGDMADGQLQWIGASDIWLFDNTNVVGKTCFDLGTDTNATEFAVRNNSGDNLLLVEGNGGITLGGGLFSSIQKPTVATDITIDLTAGNYVHFTSDTDYGAANKATAAMDILVTDPGKFAVAHLVFEGDSTPTDPTWDGAMTITWGSAGAPSIPTADGDFLLVTLERWGTNKWIGTSATVEA